jgi:protein TonB
LGVVLPERLRTELGRRATGIALALVAELLLLLALLTLNQSVEVPKEPRLVEVDLTASDYPEPAPEQPEPEQSEPRPADRPAPQPVQTAAPAVPQPVPPPAAVIPLPTAPTAPPPVERSPPAAPAGPVYGPPDTRSRASTDSVRVGTAPDGSPLYAARWYREPGKEFFGFLSTASPGWGLVACRTIPNFYVTDCVPLGETSGSMLSRSILAGSGVLRVRPAQLGGRSLVGSWVRIRIDYTIRRE